jgi:hypothetical protein
MTTAAEYNHCKETSAGLRCLGLKYGSMSKRKEQLLTGEF